MRITADPNLLVRATTDDDLGQAILARALLGSAERVAIPVAVLCEFAWVLGGGYRYTKAQIGSAIQSYIDARSVTTDRAAVEAGLRLLAAGGDFADGAVAQQGRAAGGAMFASFDRTALRLLSALGHPVHQPV